MRPLYLLGVVTAIALAASTARAQDATPAAAALGEGQPAAGWTFTPSASISRLWDNNPLVQENATNPSGDFVSVLTPSGSLGYVGPRDTLSATYTGNFEMYRQFDSLNSYGQFENFTARHRTSPRTSFFVQQQLAVTPTTEQQLLIGVPFVRVGATLADIKGGMDHAFTKRTTMELSYDFQHVAFDHSSLLGELIGGHGQSAAGKVTHQISPRTSLVADLDYQHANIIDGNTFTVQTALAGAEHRFSPSFTAFLEAGFSHVTQSTFDASKTSPSWRAGAGREFHRFALDASYAHSFAPAFGAGETLESQDLGAHGRVAITRHLYAEGSIDRRIDSPLSNIPNPLNEPTLHSLWFNTLVGYTASPWLHIEGFFSATHQDAPATNGEIDRDRVGIQIVTTKPMRVR